MEEVEAELRSQAESPSLMEVVRDCNNRQGLLLGVCISLMVSSNGFSGGGEDDFWPSTERGPVGMGSETFWRKIAELLPDRSLPKAHLPEL